MKGKIFILLMFLLSFVTSCQDTTKDLEDIATIDIQNSKNDVKNNRRDKQKPKLDYSFGEKHGHQHSEDDPFYASLKQVDNNLQLQIIVPYNNLFVTDIVITNYMNKIIFQESQMIIETRKDIDIVPANEYPYYVTIITPDHILTGTIKLVEDNEADEE